MTLASITRIPDRDTGGMRSTAGQDRVVESAGGWRRDRRTWWAAAALRPRAAGGRRMDDARLGDLRRNRRERASPFRDRHAR